MINESCFEELSNWKSNKVYEEIPKTNQKLLHCRWLCTMKQIDQNQVPKAHLVVKGFEEQTSEILKDSPTCSKESLRLILSTIAHNKWKINAVDIKTAFLQGEEIDRELCMLPLKEANTNNMWHLKKYPYGLVDASHKWFEKVKSVLISLNLSMSKGDPSLFYYHKNDKLSRLIAIHVDDFLWSGNELFSEHIIPQLSKIFTNGKVPKNVFRYLGLDLRQNKEFIILDQIHYINSLQLVDENSGTSIISSIVQTSAGKLLWICSQTRPDNCFDVCQLSTNIKNSDKIYLETINKIFENIKQNHCCVRYQKLGNESDLHTVIYSDAAHGNLPNGGSQGSYVIFL